MLVIIIFIMTMLKSEDVAENMIIMVLIWNLHNMQYARHHARRNHDLHSVVMTIMNMMIK